jgi:hypothetical protein
LCDEAKWTKLLEMVPHPGIRDKLLAAWARKSDESTAEDKWQQLKNMVEEVLQKQVKKRTKVGCEVFFRLANITLCCT